MILIESLALQANRWASNKRDACWIQLKTCFKEDFMKFCKLKLSFELFASWGWERASKIAESNSMKESKIPNEELKIFQRRTTIAHLVGIAPFYTNLCHSLAPPASLTSRGAHSVEHSLWNTLGSLLDHSWNTHFCSTVWLDDRVNFWNFSEI